MILPSTAQIYDAYHRLPPPDKSSIDALTELIRDELCIRREKPGVSAYSLVELLGKLGAFMVLNDWRWK